MFHFCYLEVMAYLSGWIKYGCTSLISVRRVVLHSYIVVYSSDCWQI